MRFWNRIDKDADYAADWSYLQRQRTKGELLSALQISAQKYTSDDLDIMMVHYDAKIKHLPAEYRRRLERFARIQITEGYNRLSTAVLDKIHEKERLSILWHEYASFAKKESSKDNGRLSGLKYLIAAFAMFIEEIPPHPVGMPFPGGLEVECYDGVYYCPVKDLWNDEDSALCRFCPAVQSRERDIVLSKKERDAACRDEKISNYFYNFKG
ncbi:MAG TPA: DUF2115 domain-containing protein [Methanocorpusculum sp.]|nr:DUF2115 domain-containing protein [Methanocorpusculum sp.]